MLLFPIIKPTFDQLNNTLSTPNSPTQKNTSINTTQPPPTTSPQPNRSSLPSNIPHTTTPIQIPKSHDPNQVPTAHPKATTNHNNGPLRSLNFLPASHSPPRLPLARDNPGLLGNLHDHSRPVPDHEFCQNGQPAEHVGVGDALVSFSPQTPKRNISHQVIN
jgi:hypothetical protein